ncbi:MAG: hypothetical protein DMG50_04885 [Acidobacteria bacterium]|nr:MAG: hypothetical protein DMG50_04885 [Acidobacteriota bacterium]
MRESRGAWVAGQFPIARYPSPAFVDEVGIYQQSAKDLSLLERATFLPQTFLGYESGFLKIA